MNNDLFSTRIFIADS